MSDPTPAPSPTPLRAVCVFCGSRPGVDPRHAADATWLGQRLAARGIALVYGGSSIGLMGILANAVLGAGGRAIGVIPRSMVDREIAHPRLSELHIVETMHERKQLMTDLSGAFIALPGGLGTLDELFESLTWSTLGIHAKPIGLLDVRGYYLDLLDFLDQAVSEGFVEEGQRDLLQVAADPDSMLDLLAGSRALAPGAG
jgi:uncharacterized protein (TIGR00730 family)